MLTRLKLPFSLSMSGSGMLWCWGFLHFFWSQSTLTDGIGSVIGDLPYLASTLLISFVVVVATSNRAERSFFRYLAPLGCILLVLGTLLDLAFQTIGSNALVFHLLSKIVLGSGMGIFWIAWGCLYVRCETESVEYAFMGWFPFLIVLLLIAAGINSLENGAAILYTGLLLFLPCTSLACFRVSERRITKQDERHNLIEEYSTKPQSGLPAIKSLVWSLVNLVCVFSVTSLAWNAFLYRIALGFEKQLILFALGLTALLFIIWLALRLTRHFSLSTLYRWALPLMAIGVVLYQFSERDFIVLVFLCLVIVNTGFEVMGRLFCIYSAKRSPNHAVIIVAVGFAAATAGGIIGIALWGFIFSAFGAEAAGHTLLVALVVFVVAASVALGKGNDARGSVGYPAWGSIDVIADNVSSDQSESEKAQVSAYDLLDSKHAVRGQAIAEKYGLSTRELDVLILLSQGRSRAHIRETLYISKGTVDSHIHHIYSKIGITSRDELMRLFLD